MRTFLFTAAIAVCTAAHASETATFYAEHPDMRRKVLALCQDDPGHAWHNADCMNALQGDIKAEAASHPPGWAVSPFDMTPPSDPKYWHDRPWMRQNVVAFCRNMTDPTARRFNNCAAASGFRDP